MRIRSLVIGSSLTALAAAGLVGSTASATPPSVPPPIPSPAPPPEASLDGPHNWHSNGIKLKISGDAVVRNFTLTYGPGVNSGWHRHPGLVLATVVSGTVYRSVRAVPGRLDPVGPRSYGHPHVDPSTSEGCHDRPAGHRDAQGAVARPQ